ncbi:PREDICTED: probable glutathione S-transferase [Nicotiana attenuata]|uniref:probable glutathione S-transferase n=1 Tax=Nicotiana attenuata TaxID=49451 RepID=UPI0009059A8C|nr:PREDICTED: probable glutathione S-transferase [Nicotiana attenuata]
MAKEDLRLLDFWVSPFCMRVKIAFAEKGLAYDSQEEDLLGGKSELLLKTNPIYQKVPVLLDSGKPIVESSNIVYYIDEKFATQNPLLPSCAYGRSRARFWADFIDKKIYEAGMAIWRSKGEELEIAKNDFIDIVKKLEGALGDKDYFGGDNFGYVDVIAISMTSWFHAYEKFGGFKVEKECPKFDAWTKRCLKRESVARVFPDPEKVYEFVVMLRKMHGIE